MESKVSRYEGDPADEELTARDGLSSELLAERIAEALRSRRDPGDWAFDRLLPPAMAEVSGVFWTPLDVVVRVSGWFDEFEIQTVVDVGSGVGKFCVAAALSSGVNMLGIEQRPRLIRSARQLARLFQLEDRVQFVNSTVGADPVPVADAYYLFNPFGENLFGPGEYLDEDIELGVDRYRRDLAAFKDFLGRAPVGTFVFTYNGFGGTLPSSYDQVRVARDLPNVLRASRKNR